MGLFIGITAIGKLCLKMVVTNNTCAHLLFPFQFFDFLFLYVFFNVRTVDGTVNSVTGTFIAQTCLLQLNIIARNSGITHAAMFQGLDPYISKIRGKRGVIKRFRVNSDPLYTLQFLARISLQYDLADGCAIILTPTMVSFFILRDGYFTLQGTGILLTACDLNQLWLRFFVLALIKPAASAIARKILIKDMRKTLLGKKTRHGVSKLAAEVVASSKLQVAGQSDGGEMDRKVQGKFKMVEEQLAVVREELSIKNMNFWYLARNLIVKAWPFYTAVVIFQV